jgi:hypothetical protein
MKICSHKTVISFMENPMLLEAGLQKGEKGEKERLLASIDLENRSDDKL